MHDVLVCPVAYNENKKLRSVIERYLKSRIARRSDMMIVDDASDDGTTDMIRSYAASGIATVRHDERRGVGAAIRSGIRYAQSQGHDIIVIMAGNDKDNPDEIKDLLHPIYYDDCAFVQGSRYLKPGGVGGDMPLYRKLATRLHPWLMSMITGHKITDSTNGFRAVKLTVLKDNRINIDQAWLDHYELEPYILFKALKLGYRFREVPVTKIYPPRKSGYTKMKPVVGWWSILRPLIYLGLGIKK